MSGIVGIINLDGAPVDRDLLQRMTNFMAYRGPDAQEIWIDGHVGFGHTMLRTTFEAEREKQPCSLDGQVWITADVRVDARADLVSKLQNKGRQNLMEATDPELILHAYHVWGEDCVSHLLGDFSFAIWDGHGRRVFCARDHFGVKLFYYAHVGHSFIFSNTLNSIRTHYRLTGKLNEQAVGDFLLFGYNPDLSTTTFSEVQRLPPGHALTLSGRMPSTTRYWTLQLPDKIIRYERDDDYIARFRELLRQAVQDRLRTDRVAIYLSGGLDSPTIAATVCELRKENGLGNDLHAYCCVYEKSPDEEGYYAGLVAKALSIPIHYIKLDDYKIFDRCGNSELQRPEPYDSPLLASGYDTLKRVQSFSRVALYGEDGDALLMSSSVMEMIRNMSSREVMRDVTRYFLSHRKRPPLGFGLLKKAKRLTGAVQSEPIYPHWLNESFAERLNLRSRWKTQMKCEVAVRHVRAGAYRRLTSSYWQSFLEAIDPGITMLPVEFRLPLLDVRVVNYALALPPLPWCVNKQLLRGILSGVVPDVVSRRPKTPLRFDPYRSLLQQSGAQWVDTFDPVPTLSLYIDRKSIPRVTGSHYNRNDSWVHLRPLILHQWLVSSNAVN